MKKRAFWFWLALISVASLTGIVLSIQLIPSHVKWLVGIFGFISLVTTIALGSQSVPKEQQPPAQLGNTGFRAEQSYPKYETIIRIIHRIATATDENQILNNALELMMDLVNAKAATFTTIDEFGAPLSTRVQGELPAGVSKDWLEYLSSPSARKKCPSCTRKEEVRDHCPLLYGSAEQLRIYCVPIRRLDQELGIFHLFLPSDVPIDREQEYLLRLISDQTALVLESVRLRSREAYAHYQLESVKQHLDVGFFIEELLKGLARGLEIQGAVVSVWDHQLRKPIKTFAVGEFSEAQKEHFFSLLSRRNLAKLERARNTLTLGIEGEPHQATLLTVPIPIERRDLKAALQILLPLDRELTEKQEEMLKAIVTQISFLLQNANLLAEVEIKAILQERIRLAREIHDGLAQTLGFLKLKMSQLRAYLEQGELERANQTTQLLHQAISDAYIEARHAIDQLRISIYDAPLAELLQETLDEFRESSGIPCETVVEPQGLRLPVEINAQLVRIVQESLSNIRKHAHAHQVQIQTAVKGDWLILEVRDDGVGFQPEEVSRHSQYGLRGMQERAELIGAELQIISQPNRGATVQVRLPLSQLERSWQT